MLNAVGLPTDRYYRLFTDIHAFRPFKKRELGRIGRLAGWVLANAGSKPPNNRKAAVIWGSPPDLPLRAMLQCCQAPGAMRGKVHVGCLVPENLEDLRLERIRAAIESMGPKLEAERRAGAVSVLVLESHTHRGMRPPAAREQRLCGRRTLPGRNGLAHRVARAYVEARRI